MKKNLKIKSFLIALIFFASFFYLVRAEDDDDDDEEEYSNSRNVSSSSQPTVSTKVETTSKTIIYKDSDGDGILDENDSHPNIPEIYIIEDSNQNGIVDKFEKYNVNQ